MAENEQLLAQSIDPGQYRAWSASQFAAWIVSLDAETYGGYRQALVANLVEEGVDGECIGDQITTTELKRWGLQKYPHQCNVLAEIRTLIRNAQGDEAASSDRKDAEEEEEAEVDKEVLYLSSNETATSTASSERESEAGNLCTKSNAKRWSMRKIEEAEREMCNARDSLLMSTP